MHRSRYCVDGCSYANDATPLDGCIVNHSRHIQDVLMVVVMLMVTMVPVTVILMLALV